MKIWRMVVILGLLGWWGIRPFPVFACSCAVFNPDTPATAFDRADAVFIGRVNGIWPALDSQPLRFSFAVQESWKGITTTNTIIQTGLGGGDCGYAFLPGGEYVVFAYEQDGSLGTGICSRTSPVSKATNELAYLRPLPTLQLTQTLSWTTICCGFFLLLGISLITILWQRKHKAKLITDN